VREKKKKVKQGNLTEIGKRVYEWAQQVTSLKGTKSQLSFSTVGPCSSQMGQNYGTSNLAHL
jgi:hypothetical protein